MSQENKNPNKPPDDIQIEHKMIILYLIDKMDIPMSNSQICQFALDGQYMHYYNAQQYLEEMVETEYLDSSEDNNTTRYSITDEGQRVLELFSMYITNNVRNKIAKYVSENRNKVKSDYEITANHFYDHETKEYFVKLSVYDDEIRLMDISLSVVSREQALFICNHWKSDAGELYAQMINMLLTSNKNEEEEEETDSSPEPESESAS